MLYFSVRVRYIHSLLAEQYGAKIVSKLMHLQNMIHMLKLIHILKKCFIHVETFKQHLCIYECICEFCKFACAFSILRI